MMLFRMTPRAFRTLVAIGLAFFAASPAQSQSAATSSLGFSQTMIDGAPTPTGDALGCLKFQNQGNRGSRTVNNKNVPVMYYALGNSCDKDIWVAYFVARNTDRAPAVVWNIKEVVDDRLSAGSSLREGHTQGFSYVSVACFHPLDSEYDDANRVRIYSCK